MQDVPRRVRAWIKRHAAYLPLAKIFFGPVTETTFDEIKAIIRRRFPQVRQISTAELAEWLTDPLREKPLLLDARGEKEFAVSHLFGAKNIRVAKELDTSGLKDRAIVTYCAVGYRSSALAAALMKAGVSNVFNLEGSLFQWANQGRPLYRGSKPVCVVHPYSGKWRRILKPQLVKR